MAALNPTDAVGLLKNIYADLGLVTAYPTWAIVQQMWKFDAAEATGDKYIFSIAIQKESAFLYAPTSGSGSGVQTLPAAGAGAIVRAEVEGYGIYLRSQLSFDLAARAARQGKQAFKQAYGALLKNMKESHVYRLEVSLLYGRSGLGIVDSNTSGVLLIKEAEFASGIWGAGLQGSILEAFTGTGASVSQHNTDLVISAVNISDMTVTVTGTNSSVVQNDVLYFKSARTTTGWNECPGLYAILTNNATMFNVDASVYDAWQSQSYDVDGQLSLTAIMKGGALSLAYGLEKAVLLVAPDNFADLASSESALRRYPDSGAKAQRGPRSIEFLMGQVEVEIICHPHIKLGHAMLLPTDQVHRVGSTDVTMSLPGSNEPLSVIVVGQTALELQSMSDQGIFVEIPARACLLTGITPGE